LTSRFAARRVIEKYGRTRSATSVSKQADPRPSRRAANTAAISSKLYAQGSTSNTFKESDMSYETHTEAIQNYAASTNPYIRGLCDEICDHLLMLAEAYQPQTIRSGDLERRFPGYAKGAQEASELFGIWFDALSYIIDTLTEFEDGLQTVPCKILFSR
jgi:hypothetical protein